MNTKPDDPRITAYLFDELAGVELNDRKFDFR